MLEIAHRDLQDARIQRGVQELTRALGTRIIRRSFSGSNLQIVLQHCACDKIPPPTLPVIEGHNCLELQPAVYTGGWEWYRLIGFSETDLKHLFKDLGKDCRVEITFKRSIPEESIRETLLVSTATLFGELTAKQRRALIAALDSGYYRIPRRATAGAIAGKLGVPRTSYVDHLRKAENKVLLAVGSYLRLSPSMV